MASVNDANDAVDSHAGDGQDDQSESDEIDAGAPVAADEVEPRNVREAALPGMAFGAGEGLLLGGNHVGDGPQHGGLHEAILAAIGQGKTHRCQNYPVFYMMKVEIIDNA